MRKRFFGLAGGDRLAVGPSAKGRRNDCWKTTLGSLILGLLMVLCTQREVPRVRWEARGRRSERCRAIVDIFMETEDAILMEAIVLKNSGSMTGPSKATGWSNKAFQLVVVVRPARNLQSTAQKAFPTSTTNWIAITESTTDRDPTVGD